MRTADILDAIGGLTSQRDEDPRADRQAEFMQLDLEMSFVEREGVMEVVEGVVRRIWKEILGVDIPPIQRMSYAEAMDRFGIDRPDMRYGMELVELGETAAACSFEVLRAAAAAGRVKGLVVPGGASFSRKQLAELSEFVKPYGAPGVLTFRRTGVGFASPAKKALGDAGIEAFLHAASTGPDDLLVALGGAPKVVFSAPIPSPLLGMEAVTEPLALRVKKDEGSGL